MIFWLKGSIQPGLRGHPSLGFPLVDKTTEVRTHRYLMVENAIETDHLLVWKSSTGRTFSVEVGRNSYYNYQIGKRYRFTIYPDRSEQFQIQQACR